MQIISVDEARSWCAKHGFPIADCPHWTDPRIKRGRRYVTKNQHSVSQALVRYVVGNSVGGESIIWITDWPLYHPDEMAVMMRFRASTGENRSLINAPAHIFDAAEVDDCIGCFNLCDQFRWDALLFAPTTGLIVFNSHDEVQYLSSLRDKDRATLQANVESYGLTLLD